MTAWWGETDSRGPGGWGRNSTHSATPRHRRPRDPLGEGGRLHGPPILRSRSGVTPAMSGANAMPSNPGDRRPAWAFLGDAVSVLL
ncbi:hypothetical protein GCM10023259_029980 [Thermocatellispora tengchongensis]